MRCNDCNKFVSFDEPQVEIENEELTGTTLSASVRLVLVCADCGTELKETTFDLEAEIDYRPEDLEDDQEPEFDLISMDAQPTERYQDKDKKGKTIRHPKHYYGVEVTATYTCKNDGKDLDQAFGDEIQASSMEEIG